MDSARSGRKVAVWSLAVLALAVAWSGRAWAEGAFRPPGCVAKADVQPHDGYIAADIPFFTFQTPRFEVPASVRPFATYDVHLRAIPALQEVPVTLEAAADGAYLLRPQAPLAPSDYVLSYLDLCPDSPYQPVRDPASAPRVERMYHVLPQVPPARPLGPLAVQSVTYESYADGCVGTWYGRVVVPIVPPSSLAPFLEVLEYHATSGGRRIDENNILISSGYADARLEIPVACGGPGPGRELWGETNVVEISATIFGAPALAPTPVTIEIDCSGRQAFDACAADAGVADAALPVDAAIADDTRPLPAVDVPVSLSDARPAPPDVAVVVPEPDAAVSTEPDAAVSTEPDAAATPQLGTSGCSCRVGGPGAPRAWLLALVPLAALIRRRRRQGRGRDGRASC